MARDRDPLGRPVNARPRDGLGRLLPRGVAGVARTPAYLDPDPQDALSMAQDLLDAGKPFHAHEVLESSWKSAPEYERDLWQGLAQLAVGLTHQLRGNVKGARTVLSRGQSRIAPYAADPPHGIDVTGLLDWTHELLAVLDDPASSPRTPRLRRTQRH